MDGNGAFFITENGNLIFDISYASPPDSPEAEHEKMIQIPGVIETGFFVGLAGRVVVGHPDGRTEIL
jgi:ribose 5-phosphate isomerase A